VLAALALTGVAGLRATRRVPWKVVALGAIVGLAQLFVTAVIFRFHTYGLKVGPLSNIARFWTPPPGGRPPVEQVLVVAGVVVGYLLNLQLRRAGSAGPVSRSGCCSRRGDSYWSSSGRNCPAGPRPGSEPARCCSRSR
jgi:hypothetical protein